MKTLIAIALSIIISSAVMAQPGNTIIPQRLIHTDQYHNKPVKTFGLGLIETDIKKSDGPSLDMLKKIIDSGLLAKKSSVSLPADKNFSKKSLSTGKQNLDSITEEFFDQEEQMWIEDYKYQFTYNSDGNHFSSIYFNKDSLSGEWMPDDKDFYEYDSNNRQILYIYYSWDSQKDEWSEQYKYESAYDSEGNLILFAEYNKDSQDGDWMGLNKEESEFDSDGNLITYIYFSWDHSENKWIESYKSESIIENGLMKFYREFNWNIEINGWLMHQEMRHEYLDGLIVSIISSGNRINEENEYVNVDFSKTEYFYDNLGKLTSEIEYEKNDENNSWEAFLKTEYTYNANDEVTTSLLSVFYDLEWNVYYRSEFTYDPNGNMPSTIISLLESGEWIPAYRDLYNFDSDGNLIFHVTSFFDFDSNDWEDEVKEEYIYDTLGNIISAIYFEYGAYKSEFTYNNSFSYEELNIPNEFPVKYFNHMLTELIQYDLIDDVWVATYRSKIFYSENNSTGIPEITLPEVRVFPNPASGYVTFQGNFVHEGASVELFDNSGKKVKSEILPADGQLAVHQLTSGIYFYKLRGTDITKNGKIVIN